MSAPTKRNRLISAADALLAEGAGGPPSMDRVAVKAGLPLSIALQDVGDVENLFRLLALRHLQALHGEINDAMRNTPPVDWDGMLQTMLGQGMHYGLAHPSVLPLFFGADGWQLVKDEIIKAEDEMTMQMAEILPPHLWEPIAEHDNGLNPFRLMVDMIIAVLQQGYREKGVLEFGAMIEAKRVALRYLSAIEDDVGLAVQLR